MRPAYDERVAGSLRADHYEYFNFIYQSSADPSLLWLKPNLTLHTNVTTGVSTPLLGDCSVLANAQAATSTAPMPVAFADGTSNTIYLIEAHARTYLLDYYMHRLDAPTKPSIDSIPYLGNVILYDTHRQATFADPGQGDVHPVVSGFPPVAHGVLPPQFRHNPANVDSPENFGVTTETMFQCGASYQTARGKVPYSPYPHGLQCSMVDGSVRLVRSTASESAFWGSVTPAGGEVASLD